MCTCSVLEYQENRPSKTAAENVEDTIGHQARAPLQSFVSGNSVAHRQILLYVEDQTSPFSEQMLKLQSLPSAHTFSTRFEASGPVRHTA